MRKMDFCEPAWPQVVPKKNTLLYPSGPYSDGVADGSM